ncbi:hypothetical protein CSOJ01_10467 [Colletotrichum sojae]|uniref:Uncharacterized protein n=1 Tax=Colletotrichum sojae TaxID=2175907 RepID=A0A8H6MPE4_9PEZI|nr:hypothetical protein CSOJ01_10467 [Colletotrichum sojae]
MGETREERRVFFLLGSAHDSKWFQQRSHRREKPRGADGNAVVSVVEDELCSVCVSEQHETEAGGAVGGKNGN